jgi:secreted Zn-dependent insulinase-like peptidase
LVRVLQVKWDQLQEALDRFSSFYICPKFDNSSTDREMRAVDSEHINSLQDDVSRQGHAAADDDDDDEEQELSVVGIVVVTEKTPS